jgi:hypothetical protein
MRQLLRSQGEQDEEIAGLQISSTASDSLTSWVFWLNGNVQTGIVNTLAASDYGLLDGDTLNPRPDYWAALLWKRLMGTRVLDPGIPPTSGAHIYAHCAKDLPGGVTIVDLNLSQKTPLSLLECPAFFEPVLMRKTLSRGAGH